MAITGLICESPICLTWLLADRHAKAFSGRLINEAQFLMPHLGRASGFKSVTNSLASSFFIDLLATMAKATQ
jgi:hypothetical protein